MLILSACPAHTTRPIDKGSYEVPGWLSGKWTELGKDGKKKDTYILEKSKAKGQFKCYVLDSAGASHLVYDPIIMSNVGGKVYLSVYSPADDMSSEGYYLFEFRKENDKEFSLVEIKEDIISENATSAEIASFLAGAKTEILGDVSRYLKN